MNMHEPAIFSELIRGAPYLAAVVFLVITFLRHIAAYQEKESVRTERIAAALEKNTEMLGRCIEGLNRRGIGT